MRAQEFLSYLEQSMVQEFTPLVRLSQTKRCPRAIVLSTKPYDFPPEVNTAAVGVLEFGNLWHAYIQSSAEYAGYWSEIEVVLKVDDMEITGHVDLYDEQEGVLFDIKTVSKTAEPFLPKAEHIAQVVAYAIAEPRAPIAYPPEELNLIYFFREDPSPSRARIYTYKFPEDVQPIIEDVKTFWQNVVRYIKTDTIPSIPSGYSPSKFPCVWRTDYGLDVRCPFFKYCWTTSQIQQVDSDMSLLDYTERLVTLAELRAQYNDLLRRIDEQYKQLIAQKVQSASGSVVELANGYKLVKKQRRDIWVAKVTEMLGSNTPYRIIEWWELKKEG